MIIINREDFPILNNDIIYFDNGATTLKPKCVVEAMNDYYYNYGANIHRGDYKISLRASEEYEKVRDKVKDFINAKSSKEIVFTAGDTDSLNKIVFGFMKDYLNEGDEVLLTKSEHASNVLPWLELSKDKKIKISYIPLNDNHELTLEALTDTITDKTKVISIAHITNVVGDVRNIHEISKIAHKNNIILVVDGAQSVPHMKTDVIKDDIDFLTFSAHKMLGPTGVGVLYAKEEYLEKMRPIEYGGGMNQYFEVTGEVEYKSIPTRFEAGTPPIAEVIGLGSAIDYLQKIGMDKIYEYEKVLKRYLVSKLESNTKVILYNKSTDSGVLAFNLEGIFSQDTAIYLDHYNICVRAGNHCAKILKDEINIKNTCRISLYFYNTKEEIDKLVEVLEKSDDLFKVIL
ncbi:MAG TPA: cysteine desulfurase [Candidatus Onthousia excrementipullorum]|uniref:cysteine desulfurase n=1 Tax=Candidatus Onthousia excrementipullorum TaxID=2840884 RepID=A0A9D1DSU2_9FIRM|nr:cysteine desulfurase [Candidatus Onthousia excrementipullorum]